MDGLYENKIIEKFLVVNVKTLRCVILNVTKFSDKTTLCKRYAVLMTYLSGNNTLMVFKGNPRVTR